MTVSRRPGKRSVIMEKKANVAQSIVVTLPLPNPKLHAHNTGHWRGKSKLIKELRTLAKLECRKAMKGKRPKWAKATIHYRFFFKNNRRRDAVNAKQSMKAAVDGVVDAGLIPDDSWQYLRDTGTDCSIDAKNPRTELVFTREDI